MSRSRITSDAKELLGDSPLELGPTLKLVGDILTSRWHDVHGINLDRDERKARGNKPLASVENIDIEIKTHGKILKIERDQEHKPAVSVPVGLSDKLVTATMPHAWIEGILLQTLISVFEGDATYANKIASLINGWIDDATIETDDGKLKIDQSKLPEPKNAVDVAEMLDSMKRTFVSKSKGTTQLNLKMSILDVEDMVRSPIMIDDRDIIAIPDVDNTRINSMSRHPTTPLDITAIMDDSSDKEVLGMRDESLGVALSPPLLETTAVVTDREELSTTLIDVIGIEGRTIGYIGKNMASDKDTWKPRLEALVESGILRKEGVRRSCRYYLGVLQ